MKRALALAALFLAALGSFGVQAQKGRMTGEDREARESLEIFEQRGLFPTGLSPLFPEGIDCPGISSPYGSPTRYDGSPRSNDHHGLHNGMDITLDARTPLLAVADGDVAHTGAAGRLVGNFIWIRFPPEATGLPVYIFAKYQHLNEPSPLRPGDKVSQGQTVGLAGNTGTTGGHYGNLGYTHLHINLLASPGPDFTTAGPMLRPETITYLDPMGLYGPSLADNHKLNALADAGKRLPVSVMTQDGKHVANGSKPIWPVACRAAK